MARQGSSVDVSVGGGKPSAPKPTSPIDGSAGPSQEQRPSSNESQPQGPVQQEPASQPSPRPAQIMGDAPKQQNTDSVENKTIAQDVVVNPAPEQRKQDNDEQLKRWTFESGRIPAQNVAEVEVVTDPNAYDASIPYQPEPEPAPEPIKARAVSERPKEAPKEKPIDQATGEREMVTNNPDDVLVRASEALALGGRKSEINEDARPQPTIADGAPTERPPQEPNTYDLPSNRFSDAVKRIRDAAKEAIQHKSNDGMAISDKLFGSRLLKMDEVSIGTDHIEALLRNPKSRFLDEVEKVTGVAIDRNRPNAVRAIADLVNGSRINALLFKSPVNKGSSSQVRILRVHPGRGIKIHPTQSKAYNADFDGDPVNLTIDQSVMSSYKNGMAYLIDVDGKCTIDPDFFHVPRLMGNEISHSDAMRFIEDYVLDWYNGDLSKIGNALIELGNENNEQNWSNLMMAIKDAASTSEDQFRTMSDILTSIYTAMREVRLMQAEFEIESESPISEIETPNPIDNFHKMILEDMHDGAPPMNYQEYTVLRNNYIGEVGGKNVMFRSCADVCKLIRYDERMIVGEGAAREFFDKLMSTGVSMQISGRINSGSIQHYAGTILKRAVIKKVGFPDNYSSMQEFLAAFASEYHIMERMFSIANIEVRTDFSISNGKANYIVGLTDSGSTIRSLITPLINVYGDFTLGRFFASSASFAKSKYAKSKSPFFMGKDGLTFEPQYEEMTIRDLSEWNRIESLIETAKKMGSARWKDMSDVDISIALFQMIADKKTSTASAFHKALVGDPHRHKSGMLLSMGQLVKALAKQIKDSSTNDWRAWASDITEMLYITGPDVFSYFNMDSPATFVNSRYGRELMKVADINENNQIIDRTGGIRMSMLIEYRLSKVQNMQDRLAELMQQDVIDEAKVENTVNKIDMELDMLASSSMVWSAIVKEMRSGEMWEALSTGKGNLMMQANVSEASSKDYWPNRSHSSLLEFLLDPSVGMQMKESMLRDLCCWHERYAFVLPFEISYQLELDKDRTYAGPGMGSVSSPTKIVGTATDRIDKFAKRSYKAAVENIQEAYEAHKDNEGILNATLTALDNNPDALVHMDDSLFADAIATQLDKEYPQSEKARQAMATNIMYYGLSMQVNGGFFTDVDRTDAFLVGLVREDQVSMRDLIHILANPDAQLAVYNSRGAVEIYTCDSLCGGHEEQDKWNFLLRNPRAAMAIRQHQVNSLGDKKSRGFLSAVGSTKDALDTVGYVDEYVTGRAKSHLWDSPKYGGLVALLVPIHGKSSRTARHEYIRCEKNLRETFIYLSKDRMVNRKEGVEKREQDDYDIATVVENNLGVTVEKLIEAGISEEAAADLFAEIVDNMDELTWDVMIPDDYDTGRLKSWSENDFAFDLESIANYYDAKQDLNGAKTSISTGIEGTETFQIAPWIAMISPQDKFEEIGDWTEEEVRAHLSPCDTNLGVSVSELSEEQLAQGVVVEVPPGYVIQDRMLDDYARQVSSVSRYVIVKRDDGAEKFNLKVKKSGSDKKNSIVKYRKEEMMGDYLQLSSELDDIYENSGLFAARMHLANLLLERNEELEYDDMDLANYVNIADLMLKEVEQDGEKTIVLRSVKQIAYAIKMQMEYDLIDKGSIKDIIKMANEIAEDVGVSGSFDGRFTGIAPNIQVHGTSPFMANIRHRSSFADRNARVVRRMITHGPALDDDACNRASKGLSNEKALKGDAEFVKPMWGYNYMGTIGKKLIENVGPRNVWVLPRKTNHEVASSWLNRAKELGITILLSSPDALPPDWYDYAADMIPAPGNERLWIIPFFDMELNGANAKPWVGHSATWQAPPDDVVWTFEDVNNAYDLGDAGFQVFDSLFERLKARWHGNYEKTASDLFADTFNYYRSQDPNTMFRVRFATDQEVRKWIVNEFPEDFAIDYGVSAKAGATFDEVKARVDERIEEFRKNYVASDHNGFITKAKPDQIIGWGVCEVSVPGQPTQKVMAPIIPWAMGEKGRSPQDFSIEAMQYGEGSESDASFTFDWVYDGEMRNSYVKFFEWSGAANKEMVFLDPVDGGTFLNGRPVDGCYAAESTATRRLGSNKRMSTLETLMFATRDYKHNGTFNFAELSDSFPGDQMITVPIESIGSSPENPVPLKQALSTTRLLESDWALILDSMDVTWSLDKEINAFLSLSIKRCMEMRVNPSDFLATAWGDKVSQVYWEFPLLFDASWGYQNSLMRYVNKVLPNVCPPSIEGDWSKTLFRPCHDKGWDFGCLQMRVPMPSTVTPGKMFYQWMNVYAGFSGFGEDFSGFSKPSINGSSNMMDAVNTAALQGEFTNGYDLQQHMRFAMASKPRLDEPGTYEFDFDRFAEEQANG